MSRVRSVPSRSWQLASSACAIVAALALLFIPLGGSGNLWGHRHRVDPSPANNASQPPARMGSRACVPP